jgi:hypothetical protein
LRRFYLGEATLTSTIILIGVALVIGVAMLSYIVMNLSIYRSQIDVVNLLKSEAVNTYVNTVLFDNASQALWLLFKRLDGSQSNYYVIVEAGGVYINCSRISVYNPQFDTNGILCDQQGECASAQPLYSGGLKGVKALYGGVIVDFESYVKSNNYPIANSVNVCMITNVCILTGEKGVCDENTIVRVDTSGLNLPIRVHLATVEGGEVYVVGTYVVG